MKVAQLNKAEKQNWKPLQSVEKIAISAQNITSVKLVNVKTKKNRLKIA